MNLIYIVNKNIVDDDTGELLVYVNEVLTEEMIKAIRKCPEYTGLIPSDFCKAILV
jgi:hypothetical protein